MRQVGIRLDRLPAISLLFAACLCLAALELKVSRRHVAKEDRLAQALWAAFRRDTVIFESPPAAPPRRLWQELEEDEQDEPPAFPPATTC